MRSRVRPNLDLWDRFLEWEHDARRRAAFLGDINWESREEEEQTPVAGDDVPGEKPRDDTADYECLLAYMEQVKKEEDPPWQPPELNDDDALKLAMEQSKLEDLRH